VKSDEKVLFEWTADEIQFGGMIFTRDELAELANAIRHDFSLAALGEHKFAATYLNIEKVRELREIMQRNIVPEITAQFLSRFWNLDELIVHAKFQRPHKMPKLDWDLPF
jgi:hypothetical protein